MACSGVKKAKQCLTLNDKLEILKIYDSTEGNIKPNELAKTLKISRSTLLTIINNRKSIETAPESDRHRFRTRNKRDNPYAGKSKYQELDEALANWVRDVKAKGEPFNGVILRNKALKLAAVMGFESFTASNGWSDRFKKKYDFQYKTKTCYCQYKSASKGKSYKNTKYGTVNFLDKILKEVERQSNTENSTKEKLSSDIKSRYTEIEERLIQWLDEARSEQTRINGTLVKEMALSIAGVLGVTKFRASSGWLNRFQKKYDLFKHKQCENCRSKSGKAKMDEEENEVRDNDNSTDINEDSKDSEFYPDDAPQEQGISRKKRARPEINELGMESCEPEFKSVVHDVSTSVLLLAESRPQDDGKRLKCFQDISLRITKEEEYQRIKMRLDKMEVELEVLRLAKELIDTKKSNLMLEIENLKMRLQLLNDS